MSTLTPLLTLVAMLTGTALGLQQILPVSASAVSTLTHRSIALPKHGSSCRQLLIRDVACHNLIDLRGIARVGLAHVFPTPYSTVVTTTPNRSDAYYTDTIYTVKAGSTTVRFSHLNPVGPSNTVPGWRSADIRDRSITLYKGIVIGMPKTAFLKLLGASDKGCDTIQLDSEARSYRNYFIFSKGKLTRILLNAEDSE